MKKVLALLLLPSWGQTISGSSIEVGLDGNLLAQESCVDAEPDRCAELDRNDCVLGFRELQHACRKTCMLCDTRVESDEHWVAFSVRNLYSDENPQIVSQDGGKVNIKTLEMIEASDDYMHALFANENVNNATSLYCVNKRVECSEWAAKGECEVNSEFMHEKCAPACRTCELKKWEETFEARCALPKNVEESNFYKEGDLNNMFSRILTSYEKVEIHSGPRELTKRDDVPDGPWLITIDDFLSEEECAHFIELGHTSGFQKSTEFFGFDENGDKIEHEGQHRTSSTTWCTDPSCVSNSTVEGVDQRIQELTRIPESNFEHFQLLRYEGGQFYNQHHDYIPTDIDQLYGPRLLTVFMYLNDVKAGGGTDFPLIGKKVMPKRGRVVVWPSVLNDNPTEMDPRTEHAATPVEEGVKYATNAWIHIRDFKAAYHKNCVA